jgi:hypothetical protein
MAINSVILKHIRALSSNVKTSPCKLVCLGYPDMLLTEVQIADILEGKDASALSYRDDSETILRWHGQQKSLTRIVDTTSMFGALGMTCDYLDIVASRGIERICDLNLPLPRELIGAYDIVYDGGTMEHCFNAPQAIKNMLLLCRLGGFIVHVNPLNYYNHAFYSFHPTFYHDFYTQSGNRLAAPVVGLYGPVLESKTAMLPSTAAFRDIPERMAVMATAQKMTNDNPGWPVQSKYLASPDLKA